MPRHISSTQSTAARRAGHVRLGWVVAAFLSSLVLVSCVMVAAAWILGGRAPAATSSVQELLPPEPEPDSSANSGEEAAMASALSPAVGTHEDYVVGEAAVVLPGARTGAEVREIPVENLSGLKELGWSVPYLNRSGYDHQYLETSSLEGVRTIQAHLSDGEHYINVAETRPEEEERELYPLREKLHNVVDLDAVTEETLELSTGHEGSFFVSDQRAAWTAAVEMPQVQYVITSNLPAESAPEIASWVLITDRSRVQLLPSSPGAGDRLERGFEELFALFD
ncbi:hypothetical protein [Nesterenkonia sp.]|uniref:hypothetical protein n=1 Tax=Nesterenkonia sp. TaxID=704201 RepID=UPI002604319E|nr:hypothetical protein [Nesterenkonia sp.]